MPEAGPPPCGRATSWGWAEKCAARGHLVHSPLDVTDVRESQSSSVFLTDCEKAPKGQLPQKEMLVHSLAISTEFKREST